MSFHWISPLRETISDQILCLSLFSINALRRIAMIDSAIPAMASYTSFPCTYLQKRALHFSSTLTCVCRQCCMYICPQMCHWYEAVCCANPIKDIPFYMFIFWHLVTCLYIIQRRLTNVALLKRLSTRKDGSCKILCLQQKTIPLLAADNLQPHGYAYWTEIEILYYQIDSFMNYDVLMLFLNSLHTHSCQ